MKYLWWNLAGNASSITYTLRIQDEHRRPPSPGDRTGTRPNVRGDESGTTSSISRAGHSEAGELVDANFPGEYLQAVTAVRVDGCFAQDAILAIMPAAGNHGYIVAVQGR